MKYKVYLLKRWIEDLLIYPFVLAGRLFSKRFEKEYDIVFFFPFYHIGGAERVHLEVARAFRDKECLIIFTKKSSAQDYLSEFRDTGFDVWEVSAHTDSKWKYWENLFYRGVVSGSIAQLRRQPIVFNGQCNFAYKISPWLDRSLQQIELIHSYCSFSQIRLPFLHFYSKTCMIGRRKIEDHLHQYKRLGVPEKYAERIVYTPNAISLPEGVVAPKELQFPIEFVFVGRNSPEKRVEWAIRLTQSVREKGLDVELRLIGDFQACIPPDCRGFVVCEGPVSNLADLYQIYSKHGHFILITSSDESGPLVLMEGMAHGMLVVSTDVGEVSLHVKDGENGVVFPVACGLEIAAEQVFRYVEKCVNQNAWYLASSQENILYAKSHFGLDRFRKSYRYALLGAD
jgi:glycosyltransferase involved in cell wall biosynthesis